MKTIRRLKQFKKDVKRIQKSGRWRVPNGLPRRRVGTSEPAKI